VGRATCDRLDHGGRRGEIHVGHPHRDHIVETELGAAVIPLERMRVAAVEHRVEVVAHLW
jgi:hypothetical protein